jgi:soluble lytic murein transglycosylase-like protein
VSVQDVVSRVEQLQQLFGAAATPGGNGGADFASQLISASASAGLAAATGTTGTSAPDATGAATSLLGVGPTGASSLPGVTATGATAASGTGGSLAGVPYGDEITAAARRNGIDPALLAGLVRQESNFNPSAVSPAGARGLTQLMPATAAGLGVSDPSDSAQALEGGARYLRRQLDAFGGDVTKALAAYNAGPGAVQRYGGVPPYAETQAYVRKVQAFAAAYRGTPQSVPYSTV